MTNIDAPQSDPALVRVLMARADRAGLIDQTMARRIQDAAGRITTDLPLAGLAARSAVSGSAAAPPPLVFATPVALDPLPAAHATPDRSTPVIRVSPSAASGSGAPVPSIQLKARTGPAMADRASAGPSGTSVTSPAPVTPASMAAPAISPMPLSDAQTSAPQTFSPVTEPGDRVLSGQVLSERVTDERVTAASTSGTLLPVQRLTPLHPRARGSGSLPLATAATAGTAATAATATGATSPGSGAGLPGSAASHVHRLDGRAGAASVPVVRPGSPSRSPEGTAHGMSPRMSPARPLLTPAEPRMAHTITTSVAPSGAGADRRPLAIPSLPASFTESPPFSASAGWPVPPASGAPAHPSTAATAATAAAATAATGAAGVGAAGAAELDGPDDRDHAVDHGRIADQAQRRVIRRLQAEAQRRRVR